MGKKKAKDWRKMRQDPEIYKKMEYVMLGLSFLSFLGTVCYAVWGRWYWYLLPVVCAAIAITLDILLPQYFTLIPAAKGEKKRAWNLTPVFAGHGLILLILPWKNWTCGSLFWLVALICGAVAAAILGCFAEEFRREKEYLIAVFLLGGLLGAFMTGHINEAFAVSEPHSYVLTVENLYGQDRNRSVRHCAVTLPDGRQMELHISKSTCDALEAGAPVTVEVGTGILGIEYANAYPEE